MITLDSGTALVSGPMTMDTAAAVEADGLAAIGSAIGVFDLNDVTDADSSAVAVLFSWIREAGKRELDLTFKNIPRKVCNLAGVYDVEGFLGACCTSVSAEHLA